MKNINADSVKPRHDVTALRDDNEILAKKIEPREQKMLQHILAKGLIWRKRSRWLKLKIVVLLTRM